MSFSGLGPLGCLPIIRTTNYPFRRTCLENANSDAQIYNKKLAKLLAEMQSKLQRSKLVYTDIYTPLMELIKNPKKHGN